MRWFAKADIRRSIAAVLARPLRIESVKRLTETADVWDITVPDVQCFSLANGAVVHNSDAFGLACVYAAERPGQVKSQPIDYSKRGVRGIA